MRLLSEHTLPPIIATLALALCILVISSGIHAIESSILGGFYVAHTGNNYSQYKNVDEWELRDTDFGAMAKTRTEALAAHQQKVTENKTAKGTVAKKTIAKKTATKKPVTKKKANAKKAA